MSTVFDPSINLWLELCSCLYVECMFRHLLILSMYILLLNLAEFQRSRLTIIILISTSYRTLFSNVKIWINIIIIFHLFYVAFNIQTGIKKCIVFTSERTKYTKRFFNLEQQKTRKFSFSLLIMI